MTQSGHWKPRRQSTKMQPTQDIKPLAMINRKQMVEMLIEEFPSIDEEITEDFMKGLSHLEIATFARYTNDQIDSHNEVELARCFEVVLTT